MMRIFAFVVAAALAHGATGMEQTIYLAAALIILGGAK